MALVQQKTTTATEHLVSSGEHPSYRLPKLTVSAPMANKHSTQVVDLDLIRTRLLHTLWSSITVGILLTVVTVVLHTKQ